MVDAVLTLLFILFFLLLNIQARESWKVEEQARQPTNSCYDCFQRSFRHVLKQDKYLAHDFFSLSLPLRQEDLAGMVQ